MSAFEDEIRDEFRRRAASGGPADELREKVRAGLEIPAPTLRARAGGRSLVAAGVLLLSGGLAVALAWIAVSGADELTAPPTPPSNEVVTNGDAVTSSVVNDPVAAATEMEPTASLNSTGSPDAALPVGVRRIESAELRTPISFEVPDDERFVVVAETSNVVEVSLSGPTTLSPPSVPMVRIIVPDAAISAADVESALSGPHSDTIVTGVGDSRLGKYDTRLTRLESDRGTTAVGFTVADQVFVAADGIDRIYEVHVIETESDPIVVWIDALRSEFEQARLDAATIVDSLRIVDI